MSEGGILIVCLGNICRSPVVAEVLRQRFAAAGHALAVESCGTGGWHAGHRADARMREAAREAGYDLSAHRARQIEADDFQRFDRVLGMDRANLRDLGVRKFRVMGTPVKYNAISGFDLEVIDYIQPE